MLLLWKLEWQRSEAIVSPMLAHGIVIACFVPHVYESNRRAEIVKPIEQRE